MAPPVYLASASPRRRDLLRQVGIPHRVVPVAVDEAPRPGEVPADYVRRLARDKAGAGARAVAAAGLPPGLVIGADTCVVAGGEILGKPADRAHGLAMLRRLAGAAHRVFTGVCVAAGAERREALSETRVRFAPLTDAELEAYWDSGEPRGKAGAYAIQGLAGAFVTRLEGSYSGVVGLPLHETVALLRGLGLPWPV